MAKKSNEQPTKDYWYWIVVLVLFVMTSLSDAFLHTPIKQMFPWLTDITIRFLTGLPVLIIGLVLWWFVFIRKKEATERGQDDHSL